MLNAYIAKICRFKNNMKKITVLITFICFYGFALAQIPEGLLPMRSMLEGKGITEQELKENLAGKGIDIDNIAPEDLPLLQGSIEQAIEEIEAEKGQKTGNGAVEDLTVNNELSKENLEDKFENLEDASSKEVGENVKNGASVEEAISDITLEKTNNERAAAIYGHSIFFDNTLDFFRTTQTSSTPDYYVLDVGDKVTINIFGQSQADLIYQIENDGFIRPSGMYKIYLKGVPFGQAKELLFKRFRQSYSFQKGQFNIDLNTARTISVSIYGEVNHPGTYTISAFNNALGAIIAAGGPTGKGSIRSIKLLSNGSERIIDVYEFMTNPSAAMDYGLTNGTVIFVQPIENKVVLNGPFLKTGAFELKRNENLADLLSIAGGVRQNTILDNFNVIRVDGATENLFTFDYDGNKLLVLQDLDIINFKSTLEAYKNIVSISGAVKFPGEYEVTDGLTLGSLLKKAALQDFARTDVAYLTRKNMDGTFKFIPIVPSSEEMMSLELKEEDKITVLNQRNFTTNYFFSTSGAVKNPLEQHFIDAEKSIRLSDAILLSGGLAANAQDFGYLTSRKAESSKVVSYQILNIKEALANPGGAADIVLSAYDRISIPTIESFQDEFAVSISGAVRNPGEYIYDKTLNLKDLLLKSGGFKLEAATNKIDIFRLSINENTPTKTLLKTVSVNRDLNPLGDNGQIVLQPFDFVVVRTVPDFEPIQLVTLEGEVLYPGQYPLTVGKETIADVIEKAGGLTADAYVEGGRLRRGEDGIGFIAIDFKKALKRNKNHNLILANGDAIFIDKEIDVIQVAIVGTNADEFYNASFLGGAKVAAPYFSSKRAGYYIRNYVGGFDTDAKRGKTFVRYKNGRIKKATNLGVFRIQRKVEKGSEVMVSLKPKKNKEEKKERVKKDRDVYADVRDFLALITSSLTVVVLADRL
jgi:protein involved in polysaccharide export with SLBB domain